MSQENTDTILRDLRLQRRNVGKGLKDVLVRCKTGDSLSKTEAENEKERLEPLVDEFVEKLIIV